MKKLLLLTLIAMTTVSCEEKNPLLKEWDTPFGVPPFEEIKTEHYMPALKKAIAVQEKEIDQIVNCKEEPTFENTIAALDRSGRLLGKVMMVFGNNESIASTEEIRRLSTEMSPIVSNHSSNIMLNEKLFARIKAVYDKREELGLEPDQMRLTCETYKSFERNGSNLDAEGKAALREVNTKIDSLQTLFSQNLLNETAAWTLLIDNEEDLEGLSEDFIADAAARAAAAGSEGKWLVGLDNPSVMPFLQSSANRELRVKVLDAYSNRCNNNNECDNKDIVSEIIALKLKKAQIMGYETYADYALERKMAGNAESVYKLLDEVWQPSLAAARRELADIKQMAKEDGITTILPADWRYYAEKARQAKYSFDESAVMEYLQYDNVRDGIFYVANKLFGVTFTKLNDFPLPHPEAEAYECGLPSGATRGILYIDMFARPGQKSGGAWCTSYREHEVDAEGRNVPAVMSIVGNFTRPSENKPSLLTVDETETFFHEFGHAIAGLLSDVRYESLGNFVRDFVELPSQLNEHWAFEPEVLNVYAKHYITGEVIPMELVDKIKECKNYGVGFAETELVAAMYLDMDMYSMKEIPEHFDVLAYEAKCMESRGLIPEILPRYRVPYFLHIFSHGYDVGYYSYLWANVFECDAYEAFKETGDIFNPEVAKAYREQILARVNEDDAKVLYTNFRGFMPTAEPFLKSRGLK
ncbi:MAG: M3 family metallopeptidase [Bacteroidales bacterium]|nr:M3 family metallopeptidase [Bacteroidales bacterium]